MKLLLGILYIVLAQISTYFQLQGQFLWEWWNKNPFIISLLGIPISYFYILSTRYLVQWADGELWPNRLMGFGIGVLIYAIMTYILFKEPLVLKTIISLILAGGILAVQLLWK